MKTASRVTFSLLFAASYNSHAVVFELPNDTWAQLQTAETWVTVCETGDGVCDVPAGSYTLIRFTLGGSTRENIEITAEIEPEEPGAPTIPVEPKEQFAPVIPVEPIDPSISLHITYHLDIATKQFTEIDTTLDHIVTCETGQLVGGACTIVESGLSERFFISNWTSMIDGKYQCGTVLRPEGEEKPDVVDIEISYSCLVAE